MIATNTEELVAVMTCPRCGRTHTQVVGSESVKRFMEEHPQNCGAPDCMAKLERSKADVEREAEIVRQKQKTAEELEARIAESNLREYELGFDPHFHEANTALAAWMIRNLDRSVWIYGDTGRGKTRVTQHAARIAVRDRSVRFWPAYDLAARLTEVSKHPESTLRDIYGADLLILDDLGVSNATESRLTSLAAIVDRRYIGWDQVRRAQGSEQPTFGWSSYGRRSAFGGQIWITSQAGPEELAGKLAAVNAANAAALVRRLADMCVLHKAEAVR